MRSLCLSVAVGLGLGLSGYADSPWPDRFVWVFGWNLRHDAGLAAMTRVIETGARSGLNGAVLSANLDTLCQQPPEFFRRLDELRASCDRLGVELIPSVFSIGYGGGFLSHDPHLAEGLPVVDALFVAGKDAARHVPEPAPALKNGGFEEFNGPRCVGYNFHDEPGVISFPDSEVRHGGERSLRFENFRAQAAGNARVMQEIKVQPRRCYRVSLWVKTDGLEPAGALRLTVLARDRDVAPRTFNVPATADWRKVTLIFNSLEFDAVRLYAGVWGGRAGRFWLDDWSVEEIGPVNVLRRPGTPVRVRADDGSIAFEEGKDYAPLTDPQFRLWEVEHAAAPLRLLPEGRIRPGARLRVSWYHPMLIHDSQITVCMAEPALEGILDHEARLLAERLRPRRVLLNMDEVRLGGTCQACAGRDMAQLLGECVTQQVAALRRHLPGAPVYAWSDMFDPNHNARPRYYLVQGDFTGSWRHIPKDLIMAVWGGAPREPSLRFFAQEGFPMLVACYYDAPDLEDVKGWRTLARRTPGVRGFMYTPWTRQYDLLPAFGQLLEATP